MDEYNTNSIPAYRYKETLPTFFDLGTLWNTARAAQLGREQGMPAIGQEQLLNKILLEGRADAGTNWYNEKNPKAVAMYRAVDAQMKRERDGVVAPDYVNGFAYPAAVLDKDAVSKRLGIPFELAWNGTGKGPGADGRRHAARADAMRGAQDDPRNAKLKEFLDRASRDELTPLERISASGSTALSKLFSNSGAELDKAFEWYKLTGNPQPYRKPLPESTLGQAYKLLSGFTPQENKNALYQGGSRWESPENYAYAKRMINDPEYGPYLQYRMGLDPDAKKYLQQHPKQEQPGVLEQLFQKLFSK